MNTNETLIPVQEIESSRFRKRSLIVAGVAAIVTVASLAAVVRNADDETVRPATPVKTLSMDQKLQILVERGLIPRQALQPAPLTQEQKLQDLVDRGLVPRQALEPAPLTQEQKLQDLVDRGLIPRQSLEEPVAIIYGPAHPLGAPDPGIPCSELVYTRC